MRAGGMFVFVQNLCLYNNMILRLTTIHKKTFHYHTDFYFHHTSSDEMVRMAI